MRHLAPHACLLLLTIAGAIACTGGGDSGGDGGASTSSTSSSTGSSGSSGSTSSSSSTSTSTSSSSGGASGTTVTDTGFSKACAVDDDCVPAFFGNTCAVCTGSNASIAKSAQTNYQTAYNDARSRCPTGGPVGDCAVAYSTTKCGAAKTCELVTCKKPPADLHSCGDGGI